MLVVFSDLDGTLLDSQTYSFDEARPALERLRRSGVPLVLVTSKTRAETEFWRWQMENGHPFVVENGGALFIPRTYFKVAAQDAQNRGSYLAFELGDPYADLLEILQQAAAASACRIRGFHQMSDEEVARETGLSAGQARLARLREYDEPFLLLEGDAAALEREIEARGKRSTRGGRFHHILGANDKGAAVAKAIELYRKEFGEIKTLGLGDAPNDEPFLQLMDQAVRIQAGAGPRQWNRIILEMVPE